MEINGRFWGSLQLAIGACGLSALLVGCATGQRSPRRALPVVSKPLVLGDVDQLYLRLRGGRADTCGR